MKRKHPVIIISSPSGGGKGTIIRHLIQKDSRLALSVSATTRDRRSDEQDGVNYYFLSESEFRAQVKQGNMVEWEEVYPGKMYGTLRSELERLWNMGKVIIFEIDVNGAMHLDQEFGEDALLMFITPPSLDILRERLLQRGSEDKDSIDVRMKRAEYELSFQEKFDTIIINDDIDQAVQDALEAIHQFLD